MTEHYVNHGHTRIVLYRAYHPTTRILGWSGLVENGVCVHLGWYRHHFSVARAARRTARRKDNF